MPRNSSTSSTLRWNFWLWRILFSLNQKETRVRTNFYSQDNAWIWFLSLDYTSSIDVCPIDANLVASGGGDCDIKIVDRRESKIVKVFDNIHTGVYSSLDTREMMYLTHLIRVYRLCSVELNWRYDCNSLKRLFYGSCWL